MGCMHMPEEFRDESWAKRAIGICRATIGLISNNAKLISDPQYFEAMVLQSLLTDVWRIQDVPYVDVDAELWINDVPGAPLCIRQENDGRRLVLVGDFTKAEQSCSDNRYSLFGNLGLLFKYALVILERKHVFSFHASALYREDDHRLVMLLGPAGCGKTVFVLAGIQQGWNVLTVEMAHCEFQGCDLVVHKGALYDNIRVGSLVVDFPDVVKPLGINVPDTQDIWDHKFAVDLHPVAVKSDFVVNPLISIVFPKVEVGRGDPVTTTIPVGNALRRKLYDNLSEKICSPLLLYDQLPIVGFDTPEMASSRLEFVNKFANCVVDARSVLTGPQACMKGV